MKLKILTLVGTRPELIKMSQVIKRLDDNCEHVLVHTGQNFDYELNQVFFENLQIRKPDFFLNVAAPTPAQTIANVISFTDEILEQVKPDAFVIYGDTNSCLGVISAKRRKIPVFHLEAGNRCFDQRVPEELNRKVVDHLSDINMVHSNQAKEYLVNEGVKANTVMKVGSPMTEIFKLFKNDIDSSQILVNLGLKPKEYFVVSAHREENVDDPSRLKVLLETLSDLAISYNKKIIFSVHPRTQKRIDEIGLKVDASKIHLMKPLGFFDYNKLQKDSFCVLSDSGTLTEEVDCLGFPGIMIRQTHERPEGSDEATCLMSDLKTKSLKACVDLATNPELKSQKIKDYEVLNFSDKVVRIIFSYIDFVNRTVWHK